MKVSGSWPHEAYSLSAGQEGVNTTDIVFEQRAGGRILERQSNGEEGEWARIKVWDPPRKLVLTWHPGNPIDPEVELRFTPLSATRCRVELEHRGWEAMGERAAEAREGYSNGWLEVWNRYTEAAAAA